jgi:hypothetical protein
MNDRLIWPTLITIIVLIISPAVVAAQGNNSVPEGADIIFLVDQSGSMSAGTITNRQDWRCSPVTRPDCPRTTPTDPDGLAIDAIDDGVAPILEHMALRKWDQDRANDPPEEYRFGLVLFGGSGSQDANAVIAVPLTRIEIERDSEGGIYSNIADQLPTEARNLGETAFSHAFTVVCEMLNCSTPPPPQRKRVVVLLTDGQPSLDAIAFDGGNPGPYFDALSQRHVDLFSTSELWVLGLDRTNQFWSNNSPFWEEIAPDRTFRLTDPKDIAVKLREIARATVGTPPGVASDCNGNSFTIDPYRTILTLILEYPDEDSLARFQMPNDQVLTKTMDQVLGYTRGPQSETFIIKDPPPGEWQCELVGSGVIPRFRSIQGAFDLDTVEIKPLTTGPLSPCRDFNLTVSYRDANGKIVSELPDYQLQHTITITADGQPKTYTLVPDQDRRDRWRINGMATTGEQGGDYPVRVDVKLPNGTPVFSDTQQVISVDPRLPCMQIVAPNNQSVSAIHEQLSQTSVDLRVQLTQGGQPATLTDIFREDLSHIVTGKLEGPDNFTSTVQLRPVAGQPGTFTASVDNLDAVGDYTFTANLKATTLNGAPYELGPQAIMFTRVRGDFWFTVQWGAKIAAMTAMTAALGMLGFFVFLISGPFPSGALVLEQRTSGVAAELREWDQVARIPLSSQRIFFGLFRTRWPAIKKSLPAETGLRKIKVRRGGRAGEGVTVTLVWSSRRPEISFTFSRNREHKTFDSKYRITYENYGVQQQQQ